MRYVPPFIETLRDSDKMPFGKHRGKRMDEVPFPYWRWFLQQSWGFEHRAVYDYVKKQIHPKI